MKKERNIGQEILAGIKEIKEWQQGKKKLKVTRVRLPRAANVAKIRQNLDLTQKALPRSINRLGSHRHGAQKRKASSR